MMSPFGTASSFPGFLTLFSMQPKEARESAFHYLANKVGEKEKDQSFGGFKI